MIADNLAGLIEERQTLVARTCVDADFERVSAGLRVCRDSKAMHLRERTAGRRRRRSSSGVNMV